MLSMISSISNGWRTGVISAKSIGGEMKKGLGENTEKAWLKAGGLAGSEIAEASQTPSAEETKKAAAENHWRRQAAQPAACNKAGENRACGGWRTAAAAKSAAKMAKSEAYGRWRRGGAKKYFQPVTVSPVQWRLKSINGYRGVM